MEVDHCQMLLNNFHKLSEQKTKLYPVKFKKERYKT